MSGEGVLPAAGSFAEHPLSLSEARAGRSGRVDDLTPRDALIRALRELDAGDVEADHVIAIGSAPAGGLGRSILYQGGSFGFHAQRGLAADATDLLRAKE